MSLLDAEGVVFGVQACEEARIALEEYPGLPSYQAFEVLIGFEGNSRTGIAEGVSTLEMITLGLAIH